MPLSEARKRANAKYQKTRMKQLPVKVKTERLELIKEHAAGNNEPLSTFVNRSIDETMERDRTKK